MPASRIVNISAWRAETSEHELSKAWATDLTLFRTIHPKPARWTCLKEASQIILREPNTGGTQVEELPACRGVEDSGFTEDKFENSNMTIIAHSVTLGAKGESPSNTVLLRDNQIALAKPPLRTIKQIRGPTKMRNTLLRNKNM